MAKSPKDDIKWESRIFFKDFDSNFLFQPEYVFKKIKKYSIFNHVEIYICGKTGEDIIKMRKDEIQIKTIMQKEEYLHCYLDKYAIKTPISSGNLYKIICAKQLEEFVSSPVEFKKENENFKIEDINGVMKILKYFNPTLKVISTHKQRYKYELKDGSLFEFCIINFKNQNFYSICIETDNKDELLEKFALFKFESFLEKAIRDKSSIILGYTNFLRWLFQI